MLIRFKMEDEDGMNHFSIHLFIVYDYPLDFIYVQVYFKMYIRTVITFLTTIDFF